MEGSDYWGYGYKTQYSYPRSQLIPWRRPEVKFGRKVVRKTKNLPRWGQKVRNKKKLILRLSSLISKGFPIKTIIKKHSLINKENFIQLKWLDKHTLLTLLYTYKKWIYINNDKSTNTGGTNEFYWFLASVLCDTMRERQIIKAYASHNMLNPAHPRMAHLVVLKISINLCR